MSAIFRDTYRNVRDTPEPRPYTTQERADLAVCARAADTLRLTISLFRTYEISTPCLPEPSDVVGFLTDELKRYEAAEATLAERIAEEAADDI